MKLHELDVSDGQAGPQRHGHAIARRLGRVGGDGEQLAGAPRGQQGVGRPQLDHVPVLVEGDHAPAPPGFHDEVKGEPPFPDTGCGGADGVHKGPFHLGAGGGPAGVNHACGRVAPFAGELPHAAVVAVELSPEGGQLPDPRRSFGDEHLDCGPVAQAGPGSQRVGGVQGDGIDQVRILAVVGGLHVGLSVMEDRRHPALRPLRGRIGQGAFRQHANPEPRLLLGAPGRGLQAGDPTAEDEQIEGLDRRHRGAAPPLGGGAFPGPA